MFADCSAAAPELQDPLSHLVMFCSTQIVPEPRADPRVPSSQITAKGAHPFPSYKKPKSFCHQCGFCTI